MDVVEFNLRGRVVWSRVATQKSICTINGDNRMFCRLKNLTFRIFPRLIPRDP